jgi:outer membrane protein TolC
MLTLSDAELKASTTGYEVRAGHFEERVREWEKRGAVAGYLPTVDYTLGYMRMDDETVGRANSAYDMFTSGSPLLPPGVELDIENPNPLYTRSFSHQLSVSQPIVNGGLEIIAIDMARRTERAAEFGLEAVRQDAIYAARRAYFDAISAAQRSAVAEQALSWARASLVKARVREQAGTVPVTDVLQWEADVAQKESDLMQARAMQRYTLLSLFEAMGVAVSKADTSVSLQPITVFERWYAKGQAALDGSAEMSPRLQSVKAYTEVAEGAKRIAIARFLPKVNAYYSYSWPAWDKLRPNTERDGWTAGVTANIPVFGGLRNATGYRTAQYEYMKTVVNEQQLENQLALALERVSLFYEAAFGGVGSARKQTELMEKQLEIMEKRYDGGLVNQSQLLEVELGLRQALIGYINKLFECLLLEAEYLSIVGKLEVAQ